jgi:hypothetical protein
MFESLNLPPADEPVKSGMARGRYFEVERVDEDPVSRDLAPGAGPFGGGAS